MTSLHLPTLRLYVSLNLHINKWSPTGGVRESLNYFIHTVAVIELIIQRVSELGKPHMRVCKV